MRGRVASLLEVGTGFHPELSGRENIYLNGALLGYGNDFMTDNFKSIVEFADLWNFVDVPVKNFSSGMIARLGFSIATQVRADILLVDEILAVGDFMFRQKCFKRIQEMLSGGTTLLFVSHDAEQVCQLCSKAVWLDQGHMMGYGPAEQVCREYTEKMESQNA